MRVPRGDPALSYLEHALRRLGRRGAFLSGAASLAGVALLPPAAFLLGIPGAAPSGSWTPFGVWVAGLLLAGLGGVLTGRFLRRARPAHLVAEVERTLCLRAGALRGAMELARPGVGGSADLATVHRRSAASALAGREPARLAPVSARRIRMLGALAAVLWGLALSGWGAVAAGGAAGGRRAGVLSSLSVSWRAAIPPPPPPMTVEPEGGEVLRGELFPVRVEAPRRSTVRLVWRPRGGAQRSMGLKVEPRGEARGAVGPVETATDYWAEDDRGERTAPYTVAPVDPLLIVELKIEALPPAYLHIPGGAWSTPIPPLLVPAGTRLHVEGRTNHPVRRIGFQAPGGERIWWPAGGRRFAGELRVERASRMRWIVEPAGEVPAVRMPPDLEVSVVPDRAPSIRILSPGRDASFGREEPVAVVIDARDDHGVRSVELVSWFTPAREEQDRPRVLSLLDGSRSRERVLLRRRLRLARPDLLPGDTLFYLARARDGRPGAPPTVSDTFRAIIETVSDRRRRAMESLRALRDSTAGLVDAVRELERHAKEAALRSAGSGGGDGAGTSRGEGKPRFGGTRDGRRVLTDARRIETRLRELEAAASDTEREMESTALADPELGERLRRMAELAAELRDTELGRRIEELAKALAEIDPEEAARILRGVAEDAAVLEARLERGLALMERSALDAASREIAERAHDLAERQREVAEAAREEGGGRAGLEEGIAAAANALGRDIHSLRRRLDAAGHRKAGGLAAEANKLVVAAEGAIRRAAEVWGAGGATREREARRAAMRGAESLERAAEGLEAADRQARARTRAETLDALDRTVREALELSAEQERVGRRVAASAGQTLAFRQSAIRRGMENLQRSLEEVGRRTALLEGAASSAAARAAAGMEESAEALAAGSRQVAAAAAERASAALSDLAVRLLATRDAVASSTSATGLEEALERLSALGRAQGRVNAASAALLVAMRSGGTPAEERVALLARRQAEIARALRELAEENVAGMPGSPAELAREAEEIARRLAGGGIDRQVRARQERLFGRLLSAGRTLERDEPDPGRRRAETPRVVEPAGGEELSGSSPGGVAYPYPAPAELETVPPDLRSLVLEYFDRLNAIGRAAEPTRGRRPR